MTENTQCVNNFPERRACFVKKALEAKDVELFRNGSGLRIVSLEILDYFGTSEYFIGRKK